MVQIIYRESSSIDEEKNNSFRFQIGSQNFFIIYKLFEIQTFMITYLGISGF